MVNPHYALSCIPLVTFPFLDPDTVIFVKQQMGDRNAIHWMIYLTPEKSESSYA
jgi:hypothetical protein